MTEPHVQELEKPIAAAKLVTNRTPAWRPKLLFGGKCGDMVSVRPCAERFGERTYLGVLLGEIAQGVHLGTRGDELHYDMAYHNPAILIPELDEVVFGNASWWGAIRDARQLREITDADISNVWYVKALDQIARAAAEDASDGAATASGSEADDAAA